MFRKHRFGAFAMFAIVLASAASASAGPAPYDHLQCYKIRDPQKFFATVNLNPVGNAVGLALAEGCTMVVHATEFCAPVQKTVVDSSEPTLPVVGQDLANGFLCYKLKCPKFAIDPFNSGDQFGNREITLSSTVKLCAPADY